MQTRSATGASLGLVAACAFIIIIVGIGLFFLMQVFGGFRELQHATDAGNLNVAKEALKVPSFPVTDAYQTDFAGLVDPDNSSNMDLQVYNRVVGQAFLVALNAMADQPRGGGTPSTAGLDNAALVAQAANGGDGTNTGVGQKLYQLFDMRGNNDLFNKFDYVAKKNSLRMLGNSANNGALSGNPTGWDIAFMGQGDPTNVYAPNDLMPYMADTGVRINDSSSPYAGSLQGMLASVPSKTNKYLKGYAPFTLGIPGHTWTLYGVPVYPTLMPHHISGRDFSTSKASYDATFQNIVPPNAFKSVSSSTDKSTNALTQMEAYGLVGAQNADYQMSIPHGYIVVKNLPGISPSGGTLYDPMDSLYANELFNGIYVAKTQSGQLLFTTDNSGSGNMQQWINYNQAVANGQSPGAQPPLDGVYNADGSQVTDGTQIQNWNTGTQMCNWMNTANEPPDPTCANLLPGFENAYPHTQQNAIPDSSQLMSVESLKRDVIAHFNSHPVTLSCPTDASGQPKQSGLRVWVRTDRYTGQVTTADADPGARQDNPAPGRSDSPPNSLGAQISKDGTLIQLIDEVTVRGSAEENALLNQIAQRMHEVDPATTESAAITWIQQQTQTLPMGTTWFIYFNSGWHFARGQMGTAVDGTPVPSWLPSTLPGGLPDGAQQQFQTSYVTINQLVDPGHEVGIHDHLYTVMPTDVANTSTGLDMANWTPSSGYKNELGVLQFANQCGLQGQSLGGSYTAPD